MSPLVAVRNRTRSPAYLATHDALRRDARRVAALRAWIGLCWLAIVVGVLLAAILPETPLP